MNILDKLFSIKNIGNHITITLLGIKIKISNKNIKKDNFKAQLAEINKFLKKLKDEDVDDVFSYEQNRISCRKKRLDFDYDSNIIGVSLFSQFNKIKELELKNKIRNGKKVRVCFLIDNIAKLSTLSIYEKMCNSNLFEPFLLVAHEQKYINPELNKECMDTYLAYLDLKKKYKNVYFAYDENCNVIPIESLKPDIVFTSAAYLDATHSGFTNLKLNCNYLVCYVNYALNTINYYDYHYNNRQISSCWKHFVETVCDYEELTLHSKHLGINAVLTGYPKLDNFSRPIESCKIPSKIDNGKPIVIYAPHWTVHERPEKNIDISTFLEYKDYFFNLANNNTEFNFVFKPHPTLLDELLTYNLMSRDEYINYQNRWNNLKNGILITDGEYIDLFRKSDLLITDCGSFIGEWLPTNKPCIYLIKKKKIKNFMDIYSLMGRKILEKYYLAHNQKDIENYFKMIMHDKQDPMKEDRIRLKDELFINIGSAGQKIVDYLTEILTD